MEEVGCCLDWWVLGDKADLPKLSVDTTCTYLLTVPLASFPAMRESTLKTRSKIISPPLRCFFPLFLNSDKKVTHAFKRQPSAVGISSMDFSNMEMCP